MFDFEAKNLFNRYRSVDPFPEIVPALLNSADISDYVRATGMICPFNPKNLEAATYAVPIKGKTIYWTNEGEKKIIYIKQGDEFILEKNSIAFVTLEPTFRIPDYIALRFNLKIKHIYKGLLLGTGPIVDPGFVGKLSIPLHNLTINDYTFRGGDELILIEFTKLSHNSRWHYPNRSMNRKGEYKEFRNNPHRDVEYYVGNAYYDGCSIRSSLPELILNAERSAKNAEEKAIESANTARKIESRITIGGIVGSVLAILTLLFAVILPLNSVIQDSINYVKNTNDVKKEYEQTIDQLNTAQKGYSKRIEMLENEIELLKQEIQKLKQSPANSSQNTSNTNE